MGFVFMRYNWTCFSDATIPYQIYTSWTKFYVILRNQAVNCVVLADFRANVFARSNKVAPGTISSSLFNYFWF